MLTSLGQTLARQRKKLGLTQADLAFLAGISERTLRDIEHGSDSPSIGAVALACEAVGLCISLDSPVILDHLSSSPHG